MNPEQRVWFERLAVAHADIDLLTRMVNSGGRYEDLQAQLGVIDCGLKALSAAREALPKPEPRAA